MMKRSLSIVLALCMLLSCAVFFAGCSSDSSSDWPATVGGVTIDKEPENIVLLNDVFADVVSYIGYDIKMVGRSDECDQDFLSIVPSVGPAADPDVNKIASYEADLVIADSTLSEQAKSSIEANGAKVIILDVPTTEDALKQLYIDLGTAIGGKSTGSKKGEDGYNELLEMLGNLNTASSNIVQTVAYIYLDENNQLCTFVKGTLEYKFFNYNGNTNIFSNQAEAVINPQELRLGNPNFIFYDSDEVLNVLAADEQFAHLHALTTNQTYKISKRAFQRYGASAEKAIYEMLSFIEKINKATKDEATPAEATVAATAPAATAAPATQAPAATEAAAAQAEEAQSGEDVISYSAQDDEEAYY